KKSFIVLVICIWGKFAYSQQISGSVYSTNDNDLLIGASVSVLGTDLGDITDLDGRFSIAYSGNFPVTIEVTYIGFISNQFVLSSASSAINLRLGLSEESI